MLLILVYTDLCCWFLQEHCGLVKTWDLFLITDLCLLSRRGSGRYSDERGSRTCVFCHCLVYFSLFLFGVLSMCTLVHSRTLVSVSFLHGLLFWLVHSRTLVLFWLALSIYCTLYSHITASLYSILIISLNSLYIY